MKKEVKIVNESTIFLPKSGKIYKISQRAKEVIEFYVKGFDFESIKEKWNVWKAYICCLANHEAEM